MQTPPELVVGEIYAYRASIREPLVRVEVVRLGVKTPRRVLVRFVGDEFEGRQEWVPPIRLKVAWQQVNDFIAREERWDEVRAEAPTGDTPEHAAVEVVLHVALDARLALLGHGPETGVIKIGDVTELAARLGLEPDLLRSDPLAFDEDGVLIAPWTTALMVARRAAHRAPQTILRHVLEEEARARHRAVFGDTFGRGRTATIISPEICAQVDEMRGQPTRALLREWCGIEAVDLRTELNRLRDGLTRVAKVAQEALAELRRAGRPRDAARLEDRLRAAFDDGSAEGG